MPEDNQRTITGFTREEWQQIEHQRKTVAEHIHHEKNGNWEKVYKTFTSDEDEAYDEAYIDCVPLQRFGIRDFYETFATAFSDLDIIVHTKVDVPGLSVREAQIKGQHTGKYGDLEPRGHWVSIAMIGVFVFDKGKLIAERLYFDQSTMIAQMTGEMKREAAFDLSKSDQELRKLVELRQLGDDS